MAGLDFTSLLDAAKEAGGYEPLVNGDYQVVVTDANYKQASTGRDMYVVEFTVVAGPNAKRKVWNNFVIVEDNPNALGMFFRQMAILGADSDFFSGNPSHDDVANQIKGSRATAAVEQREWNGQIKNEVNGIKPPDDAVETIDVKVASGGGSSSPKPSGKSSGGGPKPSGGGSSPKPPF